MTLYCQPAMQIMVIVILVYCNPWETKKVPRVSAALVLN